MDSPTNDQEWIDAPTPIPPPLPPGAASPGFSEMTPAKMPARAAAPVSIATPESVGTLNPLLPPESLQSVHDEGEDLRRDLDDDMLAQESPLAPSDGEPSPTTGTPESETEEDKTSGLAAAVEPPQAAAPPQAVAAAPPAPVVSAASTDPPPSVSAIPLPTKTPEKKKPSEASAKAIPVAEAPEGTKGTVLAKVEEVKAKFLKASLYLAEVEQIKTIAEQVKQPVKTVATGLTLGGVILFLIVALCMVGTKTLLELTVFMPAVVKSIKAIETDGKDDDTATELLRFWVVYCFFGICEPVLKMAFFWVPYFGLVKLACLQYCYRFNGTLFITNRTRGGD